MDARRKRQVMLTLWLCAPVFMIAALMYSVTYWVNHGPAGDWHPQHIGAGAGHTGGANAIGEALEHKHPPKPTKPHSTPDPHPNK